MKTNQAFEALRDIEYIVNGAEDTEISDAIIEIINEFRRPEPESAPAPETAPIVAIQITQTDRINALVQQRYKLFSVEGSDAIFIREDVQIPQRSVGVLDYVDVVIKKD